MPGKLFTRTLYFQQDRGKQRNIMEASYWNATSDYAGKIAGNRAGVGSKPWRSDAALLAS